MDSELEKDIRNALRDSQANCLELSKPEIHGLLCLLTHCLEAIEWKSVEDELPEERKTVLVLTSGNCVGGGHLTNHIEPGIWAMKTPMGTAWSDSDKFKVTHWRYITPKGEQ